MCTVPGKSGTFRDSAHNTLQFLQENHINTSFIPLTQQLHTAMTCGCTTLCSLQLTSVFLLKMKYNYNLSVTLYTKCKCTTH